MRLTAAYRRALAVLTLLALGLQLRADVVHLTGGRRVEGEVQENGPDGPVEVRMPNGNVVRFPRSDVERIERKVSPQQEFKDRFRKVAKDDLDALVKLLVWARDKRMPAKVRNVAKLILKIDPHDELARRELGFVVFNNRWILETELRKKKGLVRHKGEWMTQTEKDRRDRDERLRAAAELMDMVATKNAYLRKYTLRKLFSRPTPAVLAVLARHLEDPRLEVRIVAVAGLAEYSEAVRKKWPAAERATLDISKIVKKLHRVALEDNDPQVRKVLGRTLDRFAPRENFLLALRMLTSSPPARAKLSSETRDRAGEILFYTLKTAWVPELCRNVVGNGGAKRPEIRAALKRSLRVDHGFDVQAWLAHWNSVKEKFRDV